MKQLLRLERLALELETNLRSETPQVPPTLVVHTQVIDSMAESVPDKRHNEASSAVHGRLLEECPSYDEDEVVFVGLEEEEEEEEEYYDTNTSEADDGMRKALSSSSER